MDEQENDPANTPAPNDRTPKVTGIGGVFFFSDNPQKTREWYAQNLGFAITDWGASFESRDADRPDELTSLQWSPFQQGSEYFAPSQKEFMLNYRVQNIEGLVAPGKRRDHPGQYYELRLRKICSYHGHRRQQA